MAISGKQTINVGLQNESANSDSLYTAFNKTKINFDNLFANASPYNVFVANTGISITSNATTGTVAITNSGVTKIIAGTGVTINQDTGNVIISAAGSGGGAGTVTSVGITPVSNSRLTVTNTPIVSNGNINIDLATTGVGAGTYTYPTMTVDTYGRITSITSAPSAGTVTSVGVQSGSGIQVSGGPITSSGDITIINTGVTRLNAGTGISLSGSNGNVTIAAVQLGGTVSSVGVSSTSLSVNGSPVISSGTITVDLPANVVVTGSANIGTFMQLTPGTAPSPPARGMVYYDNSANKLKVYTGSTWETITSM